MPAAEDSELRFVRFENPQEFLEATKRYDESFMNFSLGSIYDYVSRSQSTAADPSKSAVPVYLVAIYRRDELLISLTHTATDFAWMLCIPSTTEALVLGTSTSTTPGLLTPAIDLLASSTLVQLTSNPLILDKVIGPAAAVHTFVAAWSALLAARGLSPSEKSLCQDLLRSANICDGLPWQTMPEEMEWCRSSFRHPRIRLPWSALICHGMHSHLHASAIVWKS
ncbi:hypothetical protein K466DRAFT_657146 [Polyporus arcularius HHB13444]|uniref:Uncharacterized protein n=1 Tax=Polyporus arcularius HHB13444 TaxID=1314778 RepID=A0A5C3NY44_9APHY|nr:hypothetical protein K466DRAFT_657146 [Polyporus arcularius HHB13444]